MPEKERPEDHVDEAEPATECGLEREAVVAADADEQPAESVSVTERVKKVWNDHRPKVLAGGAALVAAAVVGTVLLVALPEDEPAPAPYTVAVTYKVTGEGKATISYDTGRSDDPGGREQPVELLWSKKVRVSPGSDQARVSIILGEDGGRAQCAVAVRGQHRQRSTAFGEFGRATCSAKVPEKGAANR